MGTYLNGYVCMCVHMVAYMFMFMYIYTCVHIHTFIHRNEPCVTKYVCKTD